MKNTALDWIKNRIAQQKGSILALCLCNALHSLSLVLFALSTKGFLDVALSSGIKAALPRMVIMIALVLVQVAMRYICGTLSERVSGKIDVSIKNRVFRSIMNASYKDISVHHSGELINRLFSDVQVIAGGVVTIIPNTVAIATRLIAIFITLAVFDVYLILVFAAVGVLLFGASRIMRPKIKALHKNMQEKEGKVRAELGESLDRLIVIKAYNAQSKRADSALSAQNEHFKAKMERAMLSILTGTGFIFFFRAAYVAAMIYAAIRLGQPDSAMTVGTLTALLQLIGQVQQPFSSLSGIMPAYYSAIASAERLMQLEETGEQLFDEQVSFEKSISVDNVTFNYGREKVLEEASCHIEKGDFTLLSGATGQGKSTLFMLLLGLYDYEGEIKIDGTRDVSAATRRLFAYVPQGNMLLSGTVAENVCFGAALDSEKLAAALKVSRAEEFVARLPEGVNTQIGEEGCALSEGQAQRIAVARAVYYGAPVLLLDEATSALDDETEMQMLAYLKDLGKTVVMISHKSAARELCNSEYYLEKGKLTKVK
ncbi:MAG: ABC transporter ATP-binding protein [Clostridia bacterium]|nr:ABC transporter ATP-binding protein [Clostridia bacterium]